MVGFTKDGQFEITEFQRSYIIGPSDNIESVRELFITFMVDKKLVKLDLDTMYIYAVGEIEHGKFRILAVKNKPA